MNSETKNYYKNSSLSEESLKSFLNEISDSFSPPLEQNVCLEKYAEKIATFGETFEAWHEDLLIGFVAGYFNNIQEGKAFITLVYVDQNWRKNNIGTFLMNKAIEYALNKNFKTIFLEVKVNNVTAQIFYQKLGFQIVEQRSETYMMKKDLSR